MDTFDQKVCLRYGNVEMAEHVHSVRTKAHSFDPFGFFRGRQTAGSTEYVELSYGTLTGRLEKDSKPLWTLMLIGCKVTCDDKNRSVTVTVHRKLELAKDLVQNKLGEPVDGKVTLQSDHYLNWYDKLRLASKMDVEDFYEIGDDFGRGSFAVVYKGKDIRTGESVAIKVMKKDKSSFGKLLNREMDILKCVNHPNVVRTLDIFDTCKKLYIIMEFMDGGKLFDILLREKLFSERTCAEVMKDLFQGLEYLHKHNIVHRDIKPDNILCDRAERPYGCKLADFGLSNFFEETVADKDGTDQVFSSAVGTPLFIAPEIINKRPYGPAVDVWSCGVIMYLMLSGKLPFKAKTTSGLFAAINNEGLRFPDRYWHDISEEAKNLLRAMLQKDPSKRLPIGAALHHDWFRQTLPERSLSYKLRGIPMETASNSRIELRGAVRAVVLANRLSAACDTYKEEEKYLSR